MKRKKSRHKLIAVEFLSNISLDGPTSASGIVSGRLNSALLLSYKDSPAVDRRTSFSNKNLSVEHSLQNRTGNIWDAGPPVKCRDTVQVPKFYNGKAAGSSHRDANGDLGCSDESSTGASVPHSASQYTARHSTPAINDKSFSSTPTDTMSPYKANALQQGQDSRPLWSELHSKRVAICPKGFPKTILAVFSIIYHKKSPIRNQRTLTVHSRSSLDNDFNPSSQVKHSVISTNSKDCNTLLFGSEHVRPLSSFRPTGDEVLSFSGFLHPRLNCLTSVGLNASTTGCRSFSCALKEVENFLLANSDSLTTSAGSNSDTLFASTSNPVTVAGCRQTSFAVAHPVSRRTHLNTPWSRPSRARNPSGTSIGSMSGTNSIVYPDPLVWYSPLLLDDPDLLVATGKQVFQLPSYLTSVLTYSRPSDQKRDVNREFHERFPLIQLTLTKLRSIKAVLVQVTQKLSLDLWIAAHAHVLFEKLVLKLFVNKLNRRLCASATLLISAKLNDIKGIELNALLTELENSFRISRRDLLHAELDVALGLEFCLIPDESQIWIHCSRIYKNLDLPQPYPFQYFAHTGTPLIPLQSRVTESV